MKPAMLRTSGLLLLAALIVTTGCLMSSPPPEPAQPGIAGWTHPFLPPDRAVDKWDQCEKLAVYNADNLYRYLGRNATLYKEYGFEELTQTQYRVGIEGTERLTVELHRMTDNVAAFGIYSVEHDRKAEVVELGARACATDLSVDLVKGLYFVRLKLDKTVPESRDSLVRFAAYVAQRLPGDDALPVLFSAFPVENRVPNSEQYLAPKSNEPAYLHAGYRVLYDIHGKQCSMFLSDLQTPDQAVTTMATFGMSFKNTGSAEALLPGPWAGGFWGIDKELGAALVFRKGRFIGGTMGLADRKLATQRAAQLANALR